MNEKGLSKGMNETQILNELNRLVSSGETVVLATVVETSRSVPRHSGTKKRGEAIKKEIAKSGGLYNAKILSHIYLW